MAHENVFIAHASGGPIQTINFSSEKLNNNSNYNFFIKSLRITKYFLHLLIIVFSFKID